MKLDFGPFFREYETIVQAADEAFRRIRNEYPDAVKCKVTCADCCFALFDLSLIEALYINHKFKEAFKGREKQELLDKANRADRKTYQIKRQAYKYQQAGKNEVEILSRVGAERVRCPLLNKEDKCDLYLYRPITCRLYGLPISISGMSHTCGKTGFREGESYPTVYMDKIQQKLYLLSHKLVETLSTRYKQMGEMLVPLSLALLTTYDETYLGLQAERGETDSKTDENHERND